MQHWIATIPPLRYSKERTQFDRPIGQFQLQQKKLAEMITEITKAQLLTFRLGQLRDEGKATSAQISMAKRNNVDMALTVARDARQMLGGMGITGEYPIMRHMMNLESVVTYEGTHDIHLLITGLDVTGLNAFVDQGLCELQGVGVAEDREFRTVAIEFRTVPIATDPSTRVRLKFGLGLTVRIDECAAPVMVNALSVGTHAVHSDNVALVFNRARDQQTRPSAHPCRRPVGHVQQHRTGLRFDFG